MEGKKQEGSSSSLTTELFGSKDSSSSSTGIFGSIFAPSSKVLGKESVRYDVMGRRHDDSPNEAWNPKPGNPGDASKISEVESQPCPLSSSIFYGGSSIFYGGQDSYSQPQNTQGAGYNSVFKKDGGEDDSGSASRGNWWQGSLYY